jgi:hypothetical protein
LSWPCDVSTAVFRHYFHYFTLMIFSLLTCCAPRRRQSEAFADNSIVFRLSRIIFATPILPPYFHAADAFRDEAAATLRYFRRHAAAMPRRFRRR